MSDCGGNGFKLITIHQGHAVPSFGLHLRVEVGNIGKSDPVLHRCTKTRTYQRGAVCAHLDLPLEGSPRRPHGKLLPTVDPTLAIFEEGVQLP